MLCQLPRSRSVHLRRTGLSCVPIAGSTRPLKRKMAAVDEDALDAEVGCIRSAAVLANQPIFNFWQDV